MNDLFLMYAQAKSGDFSHEQEKLNTFADALGYDISLGKISEALASDPSFQREYAKILDIDIDSLLVEEKEYINYRLEDIFDRWVEIM